MIALADGDLRLELLPDLGAAVATLTFQGRDVLRPTPPGVDDPFETAAFVLAPFANRIADGHFRVGNREVQIPRNAPGQAHPLHGHAWRKPWRVESTTGDRAVLSFEHPADSWPWHYTVTQILILRGDNLEVSLSIENRDATPMPVGLGWHPYFHKGPGAQLKTHVEGVWLTDEEFLPVRLAHGTRFGQWGRGDQVTRPELIDHCHTGWLGVAEILLPEQRLRLALTASRALHWLHIYSPPGKDFFCIEPVSQMPNAVNRSAPPATTGHRLLAPAERFDARVTLSVVNSDN
ncbi:MAG TPA: aldose 1-epimerase [Steroidobacteraceae bacterium]